MKLDLKELEGYKKADLQQLAEELGVSTSGTIKEIAARCAEVEIEEVNDIEIQASDVEAETKVDTEKFVEVEAIQKYKDLELNRIVTKGEIIKVEESRALYLINRKLVK